MSFDIGRILHEMGAFALVIVGTLAIMALAAVSVFVERLIAFAVHARKTRALTRDVGPLLSQNNYAGLLERCEQNKGLPFAEVLRGGARAFMATHADTHVPAYEMVRREVARRVEAATADVRRGMSVLASVGSVAPFVGLLGTVVGIIDAFEGIAAEGSGGIGAVSAGIAEALVVTAFGLLIAIPSVLMFNALSTKVDGIVLALGQAASEFADHVEARAPRAAPRVELPSLAKEHRHNGAALVV